MIVVLAVVVALFGPSGPVGQTSPPCVDGEGEREKLRVEMLEGLDRAFANHVVRVFEVWMRDDTDQPTRARLGIDTGVSAYLQARRNMIGWVPVLCTGTGRP